MEVDTIKTGILCGCIVAGQSLKAWAWAVV